MSATAPFSDSASTAGAAPAAVTPADAAPILLSDSAVAKVLELMAEEGNPSLHLRIYVSGGGCSGFQYGFAFEEAAGEGDTLVERDGVRVIVDATSLQYLSGAHVDFQDGLDGSRFVIKNPNAKSTCGCGSSFTMSDNAGGSCQSR